MIAEPASQSDVISRDRPRISSSHKSSSRSLRNGRSEVNDNLSEVPAEKNDAPLNLKVLNRKDSSEIVSLKGGKNTENEGVSADVSPELIQRHQIPSFFGATDIELIHDKAELDTIDRGIRHFMEMEKTGFFLPISNRYSISNLRRNRERNDENDARDDEEQDEFTGLLHSKHGKHSSNISSSKKKFCSRRSVLDIVRSGFLWVQGLLAGIVSITVVIDALAETDKDLLVYYHPYANEIRRLLYILSLLSVMGSMDLWMTTKKVHQRNDGEEEEAVGSDDNEQNEDKKRRIKVAAVLRRLRRRATATSGLFLTIVTALSTFCNSFVFIITLIMATYDTLMAQLNISELTGGADDAATLATIQNALRDSTFKRNLGLWRTLGQLRLVLALIAWLLACLCIQLGITAAASRVEELRRLAELVSVYKGKIGALEGDPMVLEDLSSFDLKVLRQCQQLGLDRVEDALRSRTDIEPFD